MSEQKIITVTSPLLPNLEEYNTLLQDIWSRKWITNNGHYHQQLEKALAEYLGVEYLSLFTNGTLPLITALQALGITEGEVITTPYSFVATTHSIWWNKLKPVFVDVLPENGNIDPSKIEAAITDKTVAIMPVHVYGCPCDVEAIDAIARKHNLKVIYDAAHAFGVKIYKDFKPDFSPEATTDFKEHSDDLPKDSSSYFQSDFTNGFEISKRSAISILKFGDLSTLSFHATKVYNTIEGGAMVMHSPEMKYDIDNLKNFGFRGETTVVAPGINSKMDEMRAAYGLLNLQQVDAAIAARKAVAAKYVEALKDVKGIHLFPYEIEQVNGDFKPDFSPAATSDLKEHSDALHKDSSTYFQSDFTNGSKISPDFIWNFAYFPIMITEEYGISRDELYQKMKEANVLGRRYFYPLISTFSPYRDYPSAAAENLPVAHKLADQVICLPMHHALTDEDVQRVLECIVF